MINDDLKYGRFEHEIRADRYEKILDLILNLKKQVDIYEDTIEEMQDELTDLRIAERESVEDEENDAVTPIK